MRSVTGQRGTAMVELAVITPLLVMLLFGFIEIGRALIQTNSLTKAVTTGARYLAREPGAVNDPPHCTQGSNWATASAQARLMVAYDEGGTGDLILPILPGLDAGGAVTTATRADVAGTLIVCVVRVTAQTQFAAIFGDSIVPFLNLGPIQINAVAEERYIGE